MHPTNERQRYNVTSSLIGWVHSHNDPCIVYRVSKWNNYVTIPTVHTIMCGYYAGTEIIDIVPQKIQVQVDR